MRGSVEQMEEEKREKDYENIINEAAAFIAIDNYKQQEAFDKAKSLHEERENSEHVITDEETGEIQYLEDGLEPKVIPEDKKAQVYKIAERLYPIFEGDF
ncbi:MAG: hypothetical protein WCY51_01650 [Sulfurimonas sp.]